MTIANKLYETKGGKFEVRVDTAPEQEWMDNIEAYVRQIGNFNMGGKVVGLRVGSWHMRSAVLARKYLDIFEARGIDAVCKAMDEDGIFEYAVAAHKAAQKDDEEEEEDEE